MRAAVFKGKDFPFSVEEYKTPRPIKDQVLIKLKYAALNHRDLWLMQEQSQQFPQGVVLGSDGAGVIEVIGFEDDVVRQRRRLRPRDRR